MNPIINKRTKPDDGSISFPILQCWNPDTRVATIVAQVGNRRVTCRVRLSDLRKRFHIFPDDPMQSVTDNRAAIEDAARKLIENKSFEDDGSIMIRYEDLQ